MAFVSLHWPCACFQWHFLPWFPSHCPRTPSPWVPGGCKCTRSPLPVPLPPHHQVLGAKNKSTNSHCIKGKSTNNQTNVRCILPYILNPFRSKFRYCKHATKYLSLQVTILKPSSLQIVFPMCYIKRRKKNHVTVIPIRESHEFYFTWNSSKLLHLIFLWKNLPQLLHNTVNQ